MPRETRSEIDKKLGLHWYISDTDGTGGRLRCTLEDFIVEEILLDGTVIHTTLTGREIRLPSKPGPWLWIAIEKRRVDTYSVAIRIAKVFRVKTSMVTYGGLKDTIAVAAQVFSVPSTDTSKIRELENDRIKVLAYSLMDRPFTSQEIWGNHFIITAREVEKPDPELVRETIRQVEEQGLPNYYGYQRFGLRRPNTHIVGKYIVLGDLEKALTQFLGEPWIDEDENIAKAREYFLKGDYKKALEHLPRSIRFYPERTVLEHLAKNPRDYAGALRKLPPDLLRLYVESYQSYIFNLCLSKRIELGLSIKYAEVGDHIALLDHHKLPTHHIIYITNEKLKEKANKLIEQEKACLVIPIPGYKYRPLAGPQHDIIRQILKQEGIDPHMFKLKHLPEISLEGTYRQASIKPTIEKLEIDKQNKTVRLAFKLSRGSYATILLREIIKPEDPHKAGF